MINECPILVSVRFCRYTLLLHDPFQFRHAEAKSSSMIQHDVGSNSLVHLAEVSLPDHGRAADGYSMETLGSLREANLFLFFSMGGVGDVA